MRRGAINKANAAGQLQRHADLNRRLLRAGNEISAVDSIMPTKPQHLATRCGHYAAVTTKNVLATSDRISTYEDVICDAERAGFEPADQFDPVTSLAMMRIRPLCHLSVAATFDRLPRSRHNILGCCSEASSAISALQKYFLRVFFRSRLDGGRLSGRRFQWKQTSIAFGRTLSGSLPNRDLQKQHDLRNADNTVNENWHRPAGRFNVVRSMR